MTMLDEVKPNGHAHAEPVTRAWDARLARIERQLADIAETGEQRVVILRDAIADFAAAELAKRDEEIVNLKKQLADFQQKLEQQAAIDQRVHEISARLEERQARRDRGKNGIMDGDFIQVFAQERQSARKEFKAADEEMQRAFEAKLAALEGRVKAVPGKLPVSKIWRPESVTCEGEVVSYDGSLYQARKDTAQLPDGADWICVARAGRDGCDGRTPNIYGTFNAHETYARFDVVECDGASFIAIRDNPGGCPPGPEDGWQLLSKPGRRGPPGDIGPRGEKGNKGERGEAAPTIVSWAVDRVHYRAVPTMSDGKAGALLDLRGLFEQFCDERDGA